ncbi:MAG: hypothetical protein ORN85_00410 [Sediminibacterium sp.]|nr:hypothetical protein [Sediminibacterium sp.]
MKKIFLTSISLFFLGIFLSFSQDKISKLDVRFGIGTSQLNYKNLINFSTFMIENEINYKFSKYFSVAGSIGYLISTGFQINNATFDLVNTNYFLINTNIFYSPFSNSRKNDFRIGFGPTWIIGYRYIMGSARNNYGLYYINISENIEYNVLAANFIIEDSYTIKEQFIVGLKAFYQTNNNLGIMAKFGIKFFNKKK